MDNVLHGSQADASADLNDSLRALRGEFIGIVEQVFQKDPQ
jgi:hypothetical protein